MEKGKHIFQAVMVFLSAAISALLAYSGSAPAQTKAVLSGNDCVKCHAQPVNDMAAEGGRHRGVPCTGCHEGHPPQVKRPIAPCRKCHIKAKSVHFEIGAPVCLDCHTNPHRPLNIPLKGAGKDTCRFCHGPECWMFGKYVSKHSALDCSKCHDVHRKIPQCTQCHKPHGGTIPGDCKVCHNAHMPKISVFPAAVSSKDCGSCHQAAAGLLGATASKHKRLTCVACHKTTHKFKPACNDCHGTPHPKGILIKFPECVMCHYNPHDLNNWPGTAAKAAAGEAAKSL